MLTRGWNRRPRIALIFGAVAAKNQTPAKAFSGNKGVVMPKENDLEGEQDQGGKHGGQKGMPKPEPKPPHRPDQEIIHNQKGEDRPRDKAGPRR